MLDHPAQHFSPAFREVQLSALLEPTVFYWSTGEGRFHDPGFGREVRWDIDLLSGYRWWAPSLRAGRFAAALATIRRLEVADPYLLICFGWATAIARLALAWALGRSRWVLLYGDSTWQHERGGFGGLARSALLRTLFGQVDGALSTGAFNREFYIRHHMHPERIRNGVCPADVELYAAARLVNRRGPAGTLVVGFAGKLIPRKGAHELLAALALLPSGSCVALVAGEGSERHRLKALARELNIEDEVSFVGFVNQSEMPAFLASCDIVVVPSTLDMRVLVVIEAMAAGAAVVVSSATAVWGCGDLIEHGETGLVYRSGDPGDLAGCLRSLIADQGRLRALADAGTARVGGFGPAAFRTHLEAAVASRLH
ncbi:MAG: glycosyltransferase family 4 protein [Acidimicrobiales bacterium]